MRSDYGKGLGITCLGVFILSPDPLLIKLTGSIGGFEATFLRSICMALSWAVMVRLWRGALVKPLLSLSRAGLLAAVLLALDRMAFVEAVRLTTVANVAIIFAAVPALAAVIAFLVLKERLGRVQGVAIAASLAGVAIIFAGDLSAASLPGNALALFSAIFYALYIVCLRFSQKEEVLESLCLSGLISAAASLPFADVTAIPAGNVMLLGLQNLLILPAGFALYFAGTRFLPAAEVALIGVLEIVLGPLWAWAVISETPGTGALLGGAIVVLAVSGQALHGLLTQRTASEPAA